MRTSKTKSTVNRGDRANSKARKARILIVDCHPVIREGLVHVLRGEADFVVCGQAEDRHQALQLARVANPSLVVLGLLRRNTHGFELIKALHAFRPKLKILVLSMLDEGAHAERAIRAGASGYITKEESIPRILESIRQVLRGQIYLGQNIAALMVATLAGRPPVQTISLLNDLSTREREILELLGNGLGRRQIVERLHLDVNSFEVHRARIREKLRIKDAADLRQFAVQLRRAKVHDNTVAPGYLTTCLPPTALLARPRLRLS